MSQDLDLCIENFVAQYGHLDLLEMFEFEDNMRSVQCKDETRKKRNRQSAAKSRERKAKYIRSLEQQIIMLEDEVQSLSNEQTRLQHELYTLKKV